MEIPIAVMVEMDISEKNMLAIEKYKTLVQQKYDESVDEKYADATAAILITVCF